jgi:hypothetical protein
MQTAARKSFAACAGVAMLLGLAAACSASRATTTVLDVDGRADATPSVAASGRFVAVAWGARVDNRTDVFLAVSRDGGVTFGAPVRVNADDGEARLGGEFPPRVALTRSPDRTDPDVTVLWTARANGTHIKVAISRNGGRTFDTPITLPSSVAAGDRGWPALAVDPGEGRIHAVWLDHRGLAAQTGSSSHQHGDRARDHDGVAMAQKSGIFYASFSTASSAEQEIAKGVCYCCKTALATGPDGAIYAAWRHVYPGNLRDIAFATSPGPGQPFSSPVRVSEDGWEINGCPDDGPAMAVDEGGTVHIVWPTVVDENGPQGALFYATTRDGRAFSPRLRIPTLGGVKPSHPQIAIDARGRILVAWDEQVSGERVAAARELRIRAGQDPAFGEILALSSGPGVYPVIAATDDGFVAAWTAQRDPSRVEVRRLTLP